MSDIKQCLNSTEQSMQKCVNHFSVELKKLRAGKAQPSMLDHLLVAYYGNPTPVNQVAAVSLADAKTIVVKPWEKSMIAIIENAIIQSDLGIVPQNDCDIIRLVVPPLTEERRKDLVKQIKKEAEKSKTAIRTCRKQSKQTL